MYLLLLLSEQWLEASSTGCSLLSGNMALLIAVVLCVNAAQHTLFPSS